MDPRESGQENIYRIRIKGTLNRSIKDWFGGITITPQENGETLIIGRFADQPALRGFLDQLWNLNFTILAVEKLHNQKDQDFQQGTEERRQV